MIVWPSIGECTKNPVHPYAHKARWIAANARTLLLIVLLAPFVAAQSNEPKRVLLLLQEDPSWPLYQAIDSNARATLSGGLPGGVMVFSEHMDRIHFPDAISQAQKRAWLQTKYASSKLDLMIAVGEVPTDIVPTVPLVYLGNDPRRQLPARMAPYKDTVSIWVELDVRKTMEAAQRFQPSARQLVVISGSAPFEKALLSQFRDQIEGYSDQFQIVYLTDMQFPDICQRLASLGPQSIVLFLTFARDARGTPFMSLEAISRFAAVSGAPVYTLLDTHVGSGAMGGYVTRFAEVGKQAGEMGLQLLAGRHPQDVTARSDYLFDWRQLQRWKISESVLPVGAILLNRQPNVWETYKRFILGAILVFLGQTLLIVGLLWQRTKKREAQKSLLDQMGFERMLADLSTTFINLPEEHIGPNIEKSLCQIGNYLKLDRITLFEDLPSIGGLRATFSWQRDETPFVLPVLRADKFPWALSLLQRGEAVIISDPDTLPEVAFAGKAYLQQSGGVSVTAIPLKASEQFFGVISFTSAEHRVLWTDYLVEELKLLAEIFSNALMRKRAQEALRESEERFRLFMDHSPAVAWLKDEQGHYIYMSQSYLKQLDVRAEDRRGKTDFDLYPRAIAEEFRKNDEATLALGRPIEVVEESLRSSGEPCTWLSYKFPFQDASGQIFVGGIGVDITERKKSEETLHNLTGRLITAQEEERARIARELHDDFSQRLALLGIGLSQLWKKLPKSDVEDRTRIMEMLKATKEVSSDIHTLSHQLHSSKLEHVGLGPALTGLCKEISLKHRIDVHFAESDVPPSIPKDKALCLFRVAQEALSNVLKHSRSKSAKVELRWNANAVTLRISDPGRGFDPSLHKLEGGIGMVGMSERLRLVESRLVVNSQPNCGTEIVAEVPLAAA